MSTLLSVLAAVIFCVAPAMYLKAIKEKLVTPNPASWGIWTVVGGINAVFYTINAPKEDEGIIALLSIVSAVVLAIVFVYAKTKHAFQPMERSEWAAIAITVPIVIVGVAARGDPELLRWSGVALQIPMALGFWPTVEKLLWGDAREKPHIWLVATGAYACQIVAVFVGDDSQWHQYAWPIVSLCGNLGVAIIAAAKNRRV